MVKEAKADIIRTGVGALIYLCALIAVRMYKLETNVEIIWFLAAYLTMAYGMIKKIKDNLLKGHLFDENLLMILASTGAFIIGRYAEGVAVVLFFQVGNICEEVAVGRSRKSVEGLLDIKPSFANLKRMVKKTGAAGRTEGRRRNYHPSGRACSGRRYDCKGKYFG